MSLGDGHRALGTEAFRECVLAPARAQPRRAPRAHAPPEWPLGWPRPWAGRGQDVGAGAEMGALCWAQCCGEELGSIRQPAAPARGACDLQQGRRVPARGVSTSQEEEGSGAGARALRCLELQAQRQQETSAAAPANRSSAKGKGQSGARQEQSLPRLVQDKGVQAAGTGSVRFRAPWAPAACSTDVTRPGSSPAVCFASAACSQHRAVCSGGATSQQAVRLPRPSHCGHQSAPGPVIWRAAGRPCTKLVTAALHQHAWPAQPSSGENQLQPHEGQKDWEPESLASADHRSLGREPV